jgi:RimJ/RimL family protein N-acetyltransferase
MEKPLRPAYLTDSLSQASATDHSAYGIDLRRVLEDHVETLRVWRNSKHISEHMLDTRPISESQQKTWFSSIQQQKSAQHFMLLQKDVAIGYCNVKALDHHDVRSAELLETGFYLADERFRGSMAAFFPALALNEYCFDVLEVNGLIAHVKPSNLAAFKFNEVLGYKKSNLVELTGSNGPEFLWRMELFRDDYLRVRNRFSRFESQ